MNGLCGTIIIENIFKVEKTLIQYNLNLLKYIITEDDKNVCGEEKGLIGKIYEVLKFKVFEDLIVCINCIIHQQLLSKISESHVFLN